MVNRVAFVIIWVGKLPNTFDIWFHSLTNNKEYDFFLFTDQAASKKYNSENLFWNFIDIKSLNILINSKLKYNFNLENAYKIADFKPMYGLLFEEHITQYTHWGYCDNDIIFGKISHFITPNLLENYDKLFYRGHFTIIKNNQNCNNLYSKSNLIDSKKALSITENTFFDEWYGITQIFDENKLTQFFADKWHFNVDHNSLFLKSTNLKNYFFQALHYYSNGQLYHVYFDFSRFAVIKEELLYAHVEKRKYLKNNSLDIKNKSIILNALGIETLTEPINLWLLIKNKKPNFSQVYYKLSKKIKTIFGKEKSPINLFLKENYDKQLSNERSHHWQFHESNKPYSELSN